MHFGEIIRYYRKKAGISQKELASDYCTSKHVYLIEKGDRTPSTNVLSYFSEKLGIDLFGIIPYMDSEDPIAAYMRKESEVNFKAFFNSVDDIYVVGNLQGKLIYANFAASRKLGYTEDELRSMQIIELNSKDHRAEAELILTDMFLGKRSACPIPLQKKDGTLLPVETRVWFGFWNGEPCIFGVSKDLSVQQAALDRFYKLFNNNPALMAISSLEDQTFVEVNSTFLEKLGYTKEEIIGKTSQELHLFIDNKMHQNAARDLRESGSIKNREFTVVKKDGQLMNGVFSGALIDNQVEKSYLTVMMDITELKTARLEAEKRESSAIELWAELNNIIKSTNNIIFTVDTNNKILTYNSAARDHFTEYGGIVIAYGINLTEIPNKQYATSLINLIERARNEGRIEVDYHLHDSDKLITAVIKKVPLNTDKIIFYGKDITYSKNCEIKNI